MNALVILGPTAVGKSVLGFQVAEALGGEIVSVDSRAAYRKIDIGTAKPNARERGEVPHHLIDVLDLDESNNAERFAGMALEATAEISGRKKLPILIAGSGLYLRAILDGFFRIELGKKERAAFAHSVQDISTGDLFGRLTAVDRKSSERIHPHDRYRIVRALEVYHLSGIALSEHFERQRTQQRAANIHYRKIGLRLEREKLYRRIGERTRKMIETGWVEEVEQLLREGADEEWPGLRTLGYPEVISFIHGEISRERMIDEITKSTRQYAKRQITWFRKEEEITWLAADDPDTSTAVLSLSRDLLNDLDSDHGTC